MVFVLSKLRGDILNLYRSKMPRIIDRLSLEGINMTAAKDFVLRILIFIILMILFGWGSMATVAQSSSQLNPNRHITVGRIDNDGTQLLSPPDDYGTINISWTAPGDDSIFGRADHYVIKYSTSPINDSNWDQAESVADPPAPLDGGQFQSFLVTGLYPGALYYLAIKTYDEAGNVSPISNIASSYASGIPRPLPLGVEIDTLNTAAMVIARVIDSHISVYYEFELDTVETFTAPRVDVALVADTVALVTFGGLQLNLDYFWHCRAMAQDHSDSSRWSDISSFIIDITDIDPEDGAADIPDNFRLEQSYPNPFNAEATIRYSLPATSHVTLEIYDLLGNLVLTAVDGVQAAGLHQYLWQANRMPSGTYLYRIKAGKFETTRKMTLLK